MAGEMLVTNPERFIRSRLEKYFGHEQWSPLYEDERAVIVDDVQELARFERMSLSDAAAALATRVAPATLRSYIETLKAARRRRPSVISA